MCELMIIRVWIMSRGVLQDVLARAAEDVGVKIRFDINNKKIDEASGTVFLAGGEELVADLIVGADGTLL